jgi:Ca2+-binding EF-hand superfamily protein
MKQVLPVITLATFAVVGCKLNDHAGSEARPDPAGAAKGAPAVSPQASSSEGASTLTVPASVSVPGVGSCQPSDDVRRTVSRFVDFADADSNGQVSRSEAQSAVNFVMGGFFFRADKNADGKVSPEEGREARKELAQQHPALASLLTRAETATGQTPFRALSQLTDIKADKPVTLEQVKQAAQTGLDDLFRVTDANKDQVITRAEATDAGLEGARTLAGRAFAAADANGDQYLDAKEFEGVLDNSAKAVFTMADGNHDGKLTREEAAVAVADVGRRFGLANL